VDGGTGERSGRRRLFAREKTNLQVGDVVGSQVLQVDVSEGLDQVPPDDSVVIVVSLWKLFVACNHRPTIKGSDHAIWRRVKLVPFNVVIPDEDQDKDLGLKLKQERSGILNWLIEGCLNWQRDGLTDPEAVRVATADYRAEQDVIAAFVEDCCTIGRTDTVLSASIYKAYTQWCKTTGEDAVISRVFGRKLGEIGFTSKKGTGGKRSWIEIGLNDQQTMELDTE